MKRLRTQTRERKGLRQWLRSELMRLYRDEQGVVFVLLVICFLGLSVVSFGVAAVGETIRQRIEIQNAVDAAAYSGAVIQADIFSTCAQLNQAVGWYYVELLHATLDYITGTWLCEVKLQAEQKRNQALRNARCHGKCSGQKWGDSYVRMKVNELENGAYTKRPDMPNDFWYGDFKSMIGGPDQDIIVARARIDELRVVLLDLLEVSQELEEQAADMIRSEVHDVLRKNLDPEGIAQGENAQEECFFACDMDPGDDNENWFAPMVPDSHSHAVDGAWKYISGSQYGSEHLSREALQAMGIETSYFSPTPPRWFGIHGSSFPGEYVEDGEQGDYYLRAEIFWEWDTWKCTYHSSDTGPGYYTCDKTGRASDGPIEVKASDLAGRYGDYYSLKDYFDNNGGFAWYRRPIEYFEKGAINVAAARRMRSVFDAFAGGEDYDAASTMFRVFDPSFWLSESQKRYMMATASARAGFRDDDGLTEEQSVGLYNFTADAESPAIEKREDKQAWQAEGWVGWNFAPRMNGFVVDWDAVLIAQNRARSKRVPGTDVHRDGEWEDPDNDGTADEVLQRLFDASWYALKSDVSLDESDLNPTYDRFADIPGIAAGFPASVGWTESAMAALPNPGDHNIPETVDDWATSSSSSDLDFSQPEELFKLIRH